jgi:hypothetical protein
MRRGHQFLLSEVKQLYAEFRQKAGKFRTNNFVRAYPIFYAPAYTTDSGSVAQPQHALERTCPMVAKSDVDCMRRVICPAILAPAKKSPA